MVLTRSRPRRRSLCATALLAVAALLAATGCSSDETAASGDSDAGGVGGECAESASAVVDEGRAPLELIAPPGSVDTDALDGKELWLINVVNNQLTTVVGEGFTDGAEALGMSVKVIDGKGEVNTWNASLEQAIAQDVDGIAILGIEPDLVSAPLEKAEAEGIPVVDIFNGNPADPLGTGIVAHVTPDFTKSGELLGNWMLADSGCDARAVLFGADVLALHVEIMDSITKTFESACPDCSVTRENVDLANLANDLATKVPNVLRREGDVGYLAPVFDSAVTFALPAAQQAAFDGAIVSHDGVPENLDLVRTGDQAVDGSFPPNAWIGWATVDALARSLSSEETDGYTIPVQLFDKTNIGEDNAELFPEYDDYESAFVDAWGA